jgi:pilus assembly protein CpaB
VSASKDAQQSSSGTSTGSSTGTSAGSLTITFAVTAKQAEAIVFGQEHGSLWLSLEPKDAKTGGTTVLDDGNVYKENYG